MERRGYTEGYLSEWSGPISFRDDLCNVGAILFRLVRDCNGVSLYVELILMLLKIYHLAPSDVGYDNLVAVMTRSNIEVHPLLAQLVRMLIDINQGQFEAYNNSSELMYRVESSLYRNERFASPSICGATKENDQWWNLNAV